MNSSALLRRCLAAGLMPALVVACFLPGVGGLAASVGVATVSATSVVGLNRAESTPTNAGVVDWTLTFSAAVGGVTSANFYAGGTAAGGATVGTPTSNDGGLTWTVPVTTGGGEGTLALSLANDVGLSGSIASSLPFVGQAYDLDATGPTVTVDPPAVTISKGGPVSFTVTYSDLNFDPNSITLLAAQIIVNKTPTVHISSILVFGSGNTRTVKISGLRGDGVLGIAIPANTASDFAGNPAQSSLPSSESVVDNTPPAVTISSPSVGVTQSGPVSFTVSYADANLDVSSIGFTSGEVLVNATGTAKVGSVTVSGSGSTRTVTLDGLVGNGAVGISLPADTALDLAGNSALAAGPSATASVQNPDQPPVFDGYTINTLENTIVSVPLAKILAQAHDPESDPVAVTGVSAGSIQGGLVALSGSALQYTPPNGFVGPDTFTVTLSDGFLTTLGEVNVTVTTGSGNGSASVGVEMVGTDVALKFAGIPGKQYDIQRSTSLASPVTWTTIATVTANPSGFVLFTDPSPPSPCYWRTLNH